MIYTNGRCVCIRDLEDPSKGFTFTEHKAKVNVAQFSPNGEWVASGDSEGKVYVWSVETQIVKNIVECGKCVNDLAWDSEGKRIVAVGDGAEFKARVFTWDTGNNLGEVGYHSQPILSVSFRPTRPFRIVTSAEDLQTNIFEGPPFKYLKGNSVHKAYPNAIRYAPDGSVYVSVGSDQKIVVYDGTKGDVIKTIDCKEVKDGHKGAIYNFAWSPDSKQILTVSSDKTAKIWNIADGTVVTTFTPTTTNQVEDMLVGALWYKQYMVVAALSGALYYLDPENPSKPKLVVQGHKDNLTSMSVDRNNGVFYVSDISGKVAQWDAKTQMATWFTGKGHEKTVSGVSINSEATHLVTVGYDDKLRVSDVKALIHSTDATPLGGLPNWVATGKRDPKLAAVVLAQQKLVILRDGKVVSSIDLDFVPLSVAFNADDTEVAVSGKKAKLVWFALEKDTPVKKATTDVPEQNVNVVKYSPDGKLCASVDSGRRISIFDVDDKRTNRNPLGWTFHSSNVTDLSFSPSSDKLATVSADESIIVWTDLKNFTESRVKVELAHTSGVLRVGWLDDNTLVTIGSDRCIRFWDVSA